LISRSDKLAEDWEHPFCIEKKAKPIFPRHIVRQRVVLPRLVHANSAPPARVSTPPHEREMYLEKENVPITSLRGVCSGRGHPLWGCLLMPFVLVYKSIVVYLLPCFGVYFARAFGGFLGAFCCCICKACGWYYYKDEAWSGAKALGDTEDCTAAEMAKKVERVRANELSVVDKGKRMNLFHGEIEPADLCQGALGDCWLVAAMAGMAEHPGAIRNCFANTEYTDRGKYSLRLWDGRAGKWVTVTVDDYFPVEKGTKDCIFMKPNGGKLWAILMEKAFAKLCGSYGALDGGWAVWAWHASTYLFCESM
jgi:hypothetical protein